MKELDLFLDKLWSQYTSYTPSAEKISKLFGEDQINDVYSKCLNLKKVLENG